jgi:hypothetical protein
MMQNSVTATFTSDSTAITENPAPFAKIWAETDDCYGKIANPTHIAG